MSFTVLDAAARASQPKLERPKVIPEVEVPATLESPHRLVAMTKAGANRATIYQGRVQLDQGLDLRVTQGLVNRSLRIADALIRACEARGWKWSVSAERKTVIHCEGQDVPFVLKERIPRRNGETKPGQPSWMAPIEYVSTGELGILLDAYTMIPVTRLWKDTPTQALEKRLGEVIAGLPLVAQAMKAHHAYWDNWRRQLDAEEARRKHEELAVEKLKRKRRRLDDFVARWEQASKIHAFCDALERRVSALPPAQAADAVAWIAWAREQATASDPLNGVPWRN